MATVTSIASGTNNWYTGASWVGGNVPLTTDDVVIAGTCTMVMDGDVIAASLRNTVSTASNVVINTSRSVVLTGNGLTGGGIGTGFLNVNAGTGQTVNLTGTFRPLNGDYTTGAVYINGSCTTNMNGVFYGGYGAPPIYGQCITIAGAGSTTNITGVFIGANTGPSTWQPIVNAIASANKVINVSGTFTSDLSSCVYSASTSDTITVNGVLTSSASSPVISAPNGALVRLGAVNMTDTLDRSCIFAAKVRCINSVNDIQWRLCTDTLGQYNYLYTASLLTGYPLESKVEDGTVYGPSSEFEGTMEPWDATFAQALATAQRDLQLPSILSAITAP